MDEKRAAKKARAGSQTRPGVRDAFDFDGELIKPGRSRELEIPVAPLPTGASVGMPVSVVHGKAPGPTLCLSAAVHGDELNGIEIVRRVVRRIDPRDLRGTVVAVPIVNVFGVTQGSRYLPDRRDLNRCFPGSPRGSLASRLAYLFMEKVVARSDVGIDYHSGSGGRANLPQVRCDMRNDTLVSLAMAFAPPLCLHAPLRPGSLREAASRRDKPMLLFEAGEAGRFDETSIDLGIAGTFRLLGHLNMLASPSANDENPGEETTVSWASRWLRAGRSGFCHLEVDLGDVVDEGQLLATIAPSLGPREGHLHAPCSGVIIGIQREAMVHRGDAIVHLAETEA